MLSEQILNFVYMSTLSHKILYGSGKLTLPLNSRSELDLCGIDSHQDVQCWPMIVTFPQRLVGGFWDWSFSFIKERYRKPLFLNRSREHGRMCLCLLLTAILPPWGIIPGTSFRVKPRTKHIDGNTWSLMMSLHHWIDKPPPLLVSWCLKSILFYCLNYFDFSFLFIAARRILTLNLCRK